MPSIYPISVEQTLQQKLQNFPETVYTLNPTDHLTKFMAAVLGPSGTGQLGQIQGSARSSQNLANISFFDLDTILGFLLNISRMNSEEYPISGNPFIDQFTQSEWSTIYSDDASYRERLKLCLQGLQKGGTILGLQLLAEGLAGFPFCVSPGWQYNGAAGAARLSGNPNEFILIPQFPPGVSSNSLEWLEAKSSVYQGIQNLKPANTLPTIVNEVASFFDVPVRTAVADSEWFELDREIIATSGVITPSSINNSRYWLQPQGGETGLSIDGPTFTGLQFQDLDIDVTSNIKTVAIQVLTVLNNQPPIVLNYNQSNALINTISPNQWIAFGIADSPDNYPGTLQYSGISAQYYWVWGSNGPAPYANDATHFDANGNYVYSWQSQADFIAAETASIEARGGVVNASGTAFYLPPVDAYQQSGNTVQPSNYDMIQATQVPVYSLPFGSM